MLKSLGMDISDRIAAISARIKHAATASRSQADRITLVAVSKTQSEDRIESVLAYGLRCFGENRVQEAQTRWADRRLIYPNLRLHLIGPLQSNKVNDAIALFDVIETLDRPKLAVAFGDIARGGGKLPKLLVQVNTGDEPQKSGIAPTELRDFLDFAQHEQQLEITGLMCIPPADEEPALHFALLEKLARDNKLLTLSMGMSDDFETAIKFGATHVRVGSALFGDRSPIKAM